MRNSNLQLGAVACAAVLLALGCHLQKSPPLSLEQKLDLLAGCGLKLQKPFTLTDLLSSHKREDYERRGFDLVLVGLGMTEEQPPWRNRSANVWHFDAECIEDSGDYARIAQRMSEIAQGSLPLTKIRDHIAEDRAWLEFGFKGRAIHIDCRLDADWVDTAIFGHFVSLLAESDPSKIYLYYDLGGQDCIIACTTRDQFTRLRASGVNFQPLD